MIPPDPAARRHGHLSITEIRQKPQIFVKAEKDGEQDILINIIARPLSMG
jgi:hypothetical protein